MFTAFRAAKVGAALFVAFVTLWWSRDSTAPPSLWLKLYGSTVYGCYQ